MMDSPQLIRPRLFVGYDPGGDGAHGLAQLQVGEGKNAILSTTTFGSSEQVIAFLERLPHIDGIGVDTLTCWSTGSGGWRPADKWLRARYPEVRNSVMTPNGLAGSMGINGMSVLVATRARLPQIPIVETHPKVLYWALGKRKYSYLTSSLDMDVKLGEVIGAECRTSNDHEWDALLSAFAAACGIQGRWTNDLHALPCAPDSRLITPCGTTNYYWPE